VDEADTEKSKDSDKKKIKEEAVPVPPSEATGRDDGGQAPYNPYEHRDLKNPVS